MKEFTFNIKRESVQQRTIIAEDAAAALKELQDLNDDCKLENGWVDAEDNDTYELVNEREITEADYRVIVRRTALKQYTVKATSEEEACRIALEATGQDNSWLFEDRINSVRLLSEG